MLYREIIAVCSEIHTKHKKTFSVRRMWNFRILNVMVRKVTDGFYRVK
jgi:hypothetical protein